MSNWPATPLR